MEKKDRQRQAPKPAEGRLAVPLNVQLEIAKQNQRLAEFRYNNQVRRGKAWDVAQRRRGCC
jgi:hypothetical protein